MTIKELIEELKEKNPKKEIWMDTYDGRYPVIGIYEDGYKIFLHNVGN